MKDLLTGVFLVAAALVVFHYAGAWMETYLGLTIDGLPYAMTGIVLLGLFAAAGLLCYIVGSAFNDR